VILTQEIALKGTLFSHQLPQESIAFRLKTCSEQVEITDESHQLCR
jgi:hypothetical protein